jgi:transposase
VDAFLHKLELQKHGFTNTVHKSAGRVCISKIGGKQLRHILYMAALNAKKTNAACKALYDRLVEKGKNKKLAIIAVCNKLLKQVFAVVKSGVLYQDDYFKKLA